MRKSHCGPSGKAAPEGFYAQVWPAGSGAVVRPAKLKPWLLKVPNFDTSQSGLGKRNWIPAGARITAFVRGPVPLDRGQIEQAQSSLGANHSLALLIIYRIADHDHRKLPVSCDGQPVAQIGEKQYAIVELAAGEHSCQTGQEKPLTLTTAAGEEYYLWLHRGNLGGWALKVVTATEGEEGTAEGEMAAEKPKASPRSHGATEKNQEQWAADFRR